VIIKVKPGNHGRIRDFNNKSHYSLVSNNG
jgi:hypothetical protein